MKRPNLLFTAALLCSTTALALPAATAQADEAPASPQAESEPQAEPSAEPAPPAPQGDSDSRRVIIEADLPEGFPMPSAPGQVVLKTYPAYRAAKAQGSNAFGELFRHITRNDIAMTAPVEMTLAPGDEPDDNPAGRRMDMAFLYAAPDMGKLGPEGTVEVVDLPTVQALSLGFFGNASRDTLVEKLQTLEAALAERDDLVAVGPPRLLGYNSPFVPARQRFHEIQIPVEPAPADDEQARDTPPAPADETHPAPR